MSNFSKNFETEIVNYDRGDMLKNIIPLLREYCYGVEIIKETIASGVKYSAVDFSIKKDGLLGIQIVCDTINAPIGMVTIETFYETETVNVFTLNESSFATHSDTTSSMEVPGASITGLTHFRLTFLGDPIPCLIKANPFI